MMRVQIKMPDGNVVDKEIGKLSEMEIRLSFSDGHVSILTSDNMLYITSWENVLIFGTFEEDDESA